MRRMFIATGFALSLIIAYASFASLMNDSDNKVASPAQQTFFIPKNHGAGTDECLAAQDGCGMAAAVSICESKGYSQVVSFGEASPEDMTGSIDAPAQKTKNRAVKEMPFLVTCSR